MSSEYKKKIDESIISELIKLKEEMTRKSKINYLSRELDKNYKLIYSAQKIQELEDIYIPIANEKGIGYRINKKHNMIEPFRFMPAC